MIQLEHFCSRYQSSNKVSKVRIDADSWLASTLTSLSKISAQCDLANGFLYATVHSALTAVILFHFCLQPIDRCADCWSTQAECWPMRRFWYCPEDVKSRVKNQCHLNTKEWQIEQRCVYCTQNVHKQCMTWIDSFAWWNCSICLCRLPVPWWPLNTFQPMMIRHDQLSITYNTHTIPSICIITLHITLCTYTSLSPADSPPSRWLTDEQYRLHNIHHNL